MTEEPDSAPASDMPSFRHSVTFTKGFTERYQQGDVVSRIKSLTGEYNCYVALPESQCLWSSRC